MSLKCDKMSSLMCCCGFHLRLINIHLGNDSWSKQALHVTHFKEIFSIKIQIICFMVLLFLERFLPQILHLPWLHYCHDKFKQFQWLDESKIISWSNRILMKKLLVNIEPEPLKTKSSGTTLSLENIAIFVWNCVVSKCISSTRNAKKCCCNLYLGLNMLWYYVTSNSLVSHPW